MNGQTRQIVNFLGMTHLPSRNRNLGLWAKGTASMHFFGLETTKRGLGSCIGGLKLFPHHKKRINAGYCSHGQTIL